MLRQLVSLADPKLFFMDPTLHCIAHLYQLGCFGTGSVEETFSRDVLVFSFEEDKLDLPIFTGFDGIKPASANGMNRLFKKFTLDAGFPGRLLQDLILYL